MHLSARRTLWKFTAILLVLLGLGSCGDDSPQYRFDTGREALPLRTGDLWRYRTASSASTVMIESERDMRVMSQATDAGGTTYVVSGWRFQDLPDTAVTLLRTPDALVRRPSPNDDAFQQAVGDRVLLRLPLTAGDRWTQVDRRVQLAVDRDLDGENDWVRVRTDVAVRDGGPLDLPAGRVLATWLVTTTETIDFESVPPELADSYRTRSTELLWIAQGVGPVARSWTLWGAGAMRPTVSEDQLLSLQL